MDKKSYYELRKAQLDTLTATREHCKKLIDDGHVPTSDMLPVAQAIIAIVKEEAGLANSLRDDAGAGVF